MFGLNFNCEGNEFELINRKFYYLYKYHEMKQKTKSYFFRNILFFLCFFLIKHIINLKNKSFLTKKGNEGNNE